MSEAVERLEKLMAGGKCSDSGFCVKSLYEDKVIALSIVKMPSGEFRLMISLGFKNKLLIPPEYVNAVVNVISLLHDNKFIKIVNDMREANKKLTTGIDDLINEIYGSD